MNARIVTAAALLTAAASARADTPAGGSATKAADAPPRSLHGLALGIEVGEPTSLTIAWLRDRLGFAAAIGSGTLAGAGLSFHADVQLEVARVNPRVPLRIGLGGRYYHHGYTPMSFDEVPDSHYGVRASISLAYERNALQLYAEVAPGVDVYRTASCTLASGPYSICPHAQDRPLFVQVVIGARWFLSH